MTTTLTTVLHNLRRSCRRDEAGRTDAELLESFISRRDEAAFETLLRRHGPMVLGVCRRVLRNEADAEDAFQATFLVLVRKATGLRPRALVGNWLYGVAHTTALKAMAMNTKRIAKEREAASRANLDVAAQTWHQLQPLLDQALKALPDKYRAAIVLCDLEGQPIKEAARQFGCAPGTIGARLTRGRRLLARRLGRHGVVVSVGTLAAVLPLNTAASVVSSNLTASTIEAAALLATGQATGVIPAKVAALLEGVLKTMFLSKLKTTTAVLLALFACVASASAFLPRVAGQTEAGKKVTGQGVSVRDGQQRRESTYNVRAVLRVMPPYNLQTLNDDYQDVRVLKETKEFVELEVVAYPLNSKVEAIKGNPNWKRDYAAMNEYLAPGITTNWDEAMRKDLLHELAKDGIDPDKLTDKEVVEKVSRWLFRRSNHRKMFCTFYVGFREGKPYVLPGLEKAFERDKGDSKWTTQEQFEHELFGKEMFARKSYGSCTSTAVYQTTVLRALGIPTRMILCIPPADGSDSAQVEMIEKGLKHNRVRCDACIGVVAGGMGFTSHTFCEVFVGGRWRRLNFTTLGQGILEPNYLGLMIKVHTFKDLSDANLAATWGTRYATGKRDDVFKHNNPYRLIEVSDHFGQHANLPNAPSDRELNRVTIDKAYWPDDAVPEVRAMVPERDRQLPLEFLLTADGHFFVHCQEWLENAGDYVQYKLFMRRADRNFVLKAKGKPDVSCQVSMSFYTHRSRNLCELEVVIPSAEYAKMAKGVEYTIHPVNSKAGYEWKVGEGVKRTRR